MRQNLKKVQLLKTTAKLSDDPDDYVTTEASTSRTLYTGIPPYRHTPYGTTVTAVYTLYPLHLINIA